MGLLAGVVVIALFAYVISVFVIHQIGRESGVIGALYALGAKKRDLLLHYITLPTMVTFLGGLIGAALGFSDAGIKQQIAVSFFHGTSKNEIGRRSISMKNFLFRGTTAYHLCPEL